MAVGCAGIAELVAAVAHRESVAWQRRYAEAQTDEEAGTIASALPQRTAEGWGRGDQIVSRNAATVRVDRSLVKVIV